jgi:hypothetical protein
MKTLGDEDDYDFMEHEDFDSDPETNRNARGGNIEGTSEKK